MLETIRLEGEDAARFANHFFHPTREYTEHFREHLDKIDNSMTITETKNGYIVDIPELDLSDIV